MDDHSAEMALAENYFVEMLEAERVQDYEAWCKRWMKSDLEGIPEDVFNRDVKAMHKGLGEYKSREYLGFVQRHPHDSSQEGESIRLRFVWRVIYEKNEALFVVGIRQVGGAWYVYQNVCSV